MSEHKFTEADKARLQRIAEGLRSVAESMSRHRTSEISAISSDADFLDAVANQAARAVAEVEAWENAALQLIDEMLFADDREPAIRTLRGSFIRILREKKEKQGGN